MRSLRCLIVVAMSVAGGLAAPAAVQSAQAAAPVVTLTGDTADINLFQFVDDADQAEPDTSDTDFFAFAHSLFPAAEHGPSGTAKAFVSQASTMETPAQPPFPVSPLNDIALDGTSTSDATSTVNDASGVPVASSEGSLDVAFSTSEPVPVFFGGFLQTRNTDAASGSCSSVDVDLHNDTGFTRHFVASSPNGCGAPGATRQSGWGESPTLPAGDYQLVVDYSSEVDATTDEA